MEGASFGGSLYGTGAWSTWMMKCPYWGLHPLWKNRRKAVLFMPIICVCTNEHIGIMNGSKPTDRMEGSTDGHMNYA